MNITQSTNKAVIDWQGFNVGESEGVVFKQPDAASTTLNRIHDMNPSQIDGALKANGNIMLINRNGMVFGKNSKVDVGGMIATTADIDNENFNKNDYRFTKAGNADARIINRGTITVKEGGGVALVAPGVENSGTINAKLGKVQLGGADAFTVDMDGDGLIQYDVSHSLKGQFVDHSGDIHAEGGLVSVTTAAVDSIMDSSINISGNIDVSNKAGKGGVIVVQSGTHSAKDKNGTVIVTGGINASGNKGGEIYIAGDQIALEAKSKVNASGKKGGGAVLVGGDYKGGGIMQKARKVYMDKDAFIDVSALDTGDGGKAILWSDFSTEFYGNIKAAGGQNAGNGGFVETSSKEILSAAGIADASAAKGNAGSWLLDPNNLFIIAGVNGANSNVNIAAGPPTRFDTSTTSAVVSNGSIENALNAGTSVILETQNAAPDNEAGYIIVGTNITKAAGGTATLTLRAADSIVLNAGVQIQSNVGALNVVMHSDKDNSGEGLFAMSAGSGIRTNGGNVTIGGGLDPTVNGARGSGLVGLNPGVYLDSSTIDAAGGNISMIGQGRSVGAGTYLVGIGLANGSVVKTSGSGSITIKGTAGSGDSGNVGMYIDGAASKIETVDGAIDITGIGGASTGSSNAGVAIQNGAVVQQTGVAAVTGSININGTAGAGTTDNIGVLIQNAGTKVSSINGDINIVGAGAGSGISNHGVYVQLGGLVESTGNTADAANISIQGTSGAGTDTNVGAFLVDGHVKTVKGNINFNGISQGSGIQSYGSVLVNSSELSSSGTGNVSVSGTGVGVWHDVITNGGSNIIGGPSASGNVTLSANILDLTNASVQTSGTLNIKARTPSRDINVGTAGVGLNLTDALIGPLQAGLIVVGDDALGTGSINVDTTLGAAYPIQFASSTGVITVNGLGATTGAGSFKFSGPTVLNTGLNTSGSNGIVTFDDPVTLGTDVTINSGNGAVTFSGTVNGTTNGNQLLTIQAGSGAVALGAAMGQLVTLKGLNITTTNNVTASGAIDLGTGTANISGDVLNFTGTLKSQNINFTGTTSTTAAIDSSNVHLTGPLATLTGLVNGGSGQAAANLIALSVSVPPSNARTFNGYQIGYIGSGSSGGWNGPPIPVPSAPSVTPDPVVVTPTPPVVTTPDPTPDVPTPDTVSPNPSGEFSSIKQLIAPENSVLEINNTYFGIAADIVYNAPSVHYLWDLYKYTHEAIKAFNIPLEAAPLIRFETSFVGFNQ